MERIRIVSWNMARAIRPKGLDGDPWQALETLEADIALHDTREDEVDRLLRGGVLVDLYRVVRQPCRRPPTASCSSATPLSSTSPRPR